MAECGIKKYDELPGRIGLIDVDYLRFRLYSVKNKQKKLIKEEEKIIEKLEEARKKWKGNRKT